MQKPKTFDFEELLKFEQEERIYRFRCVEGWSMVIPWVGFPLKKILDAVEPLGNAKYVAFETLYDAKTNASTVSLAPELIFRTSKACGWTKPASFNHSGDRTLRQTDAESKRRAGPARRALEIRF